MSVDIDRVLGILAVGDAVKILKGEFRGGDPEWLQQKKQDKADAASEEGDAVSAAVKVLKAEEGEGSFRGGDPELLQQKREEKREDAAIQSEGDDAGEPAEEPDPADIQEQQQKDQDRQEAAGKAFPFGLADAGHEVSPVDTLEDYRPRNNNGDPLDTSNLYQKQKDIVPGPPRRGPNQWKPWSEVLGFKVPPEGAPWQHLRRYILSGDSPEKIQHEAQIMVRSIVTELVGGLEDHPEFEQEVHDTLFKLYDNLNRGLTWDPDYQIHKARKGEVVQGHKYIYRSMGDDGEWEYKYTDGVHKDNHGIQHSGNRQGHTVDVHPEWEAQNLDPEYKNPEGAFHHARTKALEQGGTHRLSMLDPDTLEHKQKLLTINSGVGQPLELRDESEIEGRPAKGSKVSRFRNFEGFEEHFRRRHLNTEHDIHSKPWIQWMSPKVGKKRTSFEEIEGEHPETRSARLETYEAKQKEARPQMRYVPGTPYARPAPARAEKHPLGMFPASATMSGLRKRIRDEKNDQLRAAGLPVEDDEKKTEKKKFDVLSDKPFTNMLQEGLPREKRVVPFVTTKYNPETRQHEKQQQKGSRKQWDVKWKDPQEEISTKAGLYDEHKGLAIHSADKILFKHNEIRRKNGRPTVDDGQTKYKIIKMLSDIPAMEAVHRAVRTYDPIKGKFSTYLHRVIKAEQEKAMENTFNTVIAGGGADDYDDPATQRKVETALASAPQDDEGSESHDEWLSRLRNHVDEAHSKWLSTPTGQSATKEEKARRWGHKELLDNKVADMEELYSKPDHNPDDEKGPTEWSMMINSHNKANPADKIDSAMYDPSHATKDNSEAISDHMRRHIAAVGTPAPAPTASAGKFVGGTWVGGGDDEDEEKSLTKAGSQPAQPQQPDVNYVGAQGEPGALKFLYEEGPGGNIVQGTNAPEGHPDHAPDLGSPELHPGEPRPETNPELFDEQGRKLDRPVPQDAESEDNPNYNPDKTSGNHWAKRFVDPQTGDTQYAYLHRDHALDPKMKNNLAIKYLDAQLPKIRQWYQSAVISEEPSEKALGLFVALLDQGRMTVQKLSNLKVSDVYFGKNNVVTLKSDTGSVQVVLDLTLKECLEALLADKQADDPVFYVDGRVLSTITLNKFMHETFGVLPSAFQTYHATKDFSTEFQKLASKIKGESPLDYLRASKDQVLAKVADGFGVTPEELDASIDPIAVEASIMSAHMHGSVAKSAHALQGKCVFQGLPISIENKKGSIREWRDSNAHVSGKTKMHFDYGYIQRTTGIDGDQVDVYIGPEPDASVAYVIHQMKAPSFNKYDEDKVMLGFSSEKEAKDAYLKQYNDSRFFGSCTPVPMDKFKKKVFGTKDNPHMIKSMVWPVSATVQERSPDEEAFSQWVHGYPIHEHELHWQGLTNHYQGKQDDETQKKQMELQAPQGLREKTYDPSELGAAQ